MDIKITVSENRKTKPKFGQEAFPFAKVSTDHMFLMDYSSEKGWYDPRIVPFGMLPIHPFMNGLHYGQSIFEGMKAYKTPDGGALLFRPYENAARLNTSARRMCMPEIDPSFTVEAITKLVQLDKDWIPDIPGMSLYIRPFMMASEPSINVMVPSEYIFAVILSPLGHIYPGGIKPIHLLAEDKYVRAAKSGTGFAKCAGNYAGAMLAMSQAKARGFDQVLWLDGVHRKYIEEASTMNIFFAIENSVVTPELNDSIIAGITRKSISEMLEDWGYTLEERRISIEELSKAHHAGKVREVFCTGTATVITPIGEITWGDLKMTFNQKEVGSLTKRVYDELTGIQTGILPDSRGWTVRIA